MLIALFASLALQPPIPTEAPEIVAALTQDVVEIREDFSGTELIIFGATSGLTLEDEIVVVLRGPDQDIRVMEKRRNFGIWMNSAPAEFTQVPSYYAIASSRPIELIADSAALARYNIGLDHLLRTAQPNEIGTMSGLEEVDGSVPRELPPMDQDDLETLAPYREAIMRTATRDALFAEASTGVEILNGGLFVAHMALPPRTPIGEYTAEFYLFRNGRAVDSSVSPMEVRKAGLERIIYEFAHQAPIMYGLFCVALAVLFGWGANAIFSRRG